MRRSYPDAPFLSRCSVPIRMQRHETPPRPVTRFTTWARGWAPTTQSSAPRGNAHRPMPGSPLNVSTAPQVFTRRPARIPHTARTTHNRSWFLPPADTKRARTNRSGRATYSAQALGRLPWFAPCLRRSRRLRPRFDMSFSLSLLSRLKHFCTHCPKPPRHRSFAARKVTEKRVVHRASSTREWTHVRTPTT